LENEIIISIMKKIIALLFFIFSSSYGQISGCTDALAKNFNPNATTNDGSCVYKSHKIKTETSFSISDSLFETSGLIAYDNLFWTHNDDHDTTIYGMNSDGKIQKKIKLDNVVNTDWEAISQDSSYIYIGDFGNNLSGNRKDLHILRIEKKSFLLNNPMIDTLSFSYSNQTDFSDTKGNTTDFDCEAFVVSQDSIYLFSKQWSQNKSNVYVLPKTPGTHLAQFKETLDVEGLVTGATLTPNNEIVFCGYTKTFQTFLYLISDIKKFNFATANKRRFQLGLTYHQIEGITTMDGKMFYLTNESFVKKPIINNPQQMHTVDLSPYLKN
jgi:hypothetical protein